MKSHSKSFATILAIAALAIGPALSGQVTLPAATNAAAGDLVLGFWQTNAAGAGYTSNLEVDLGAYSAYSSYAGSGTLTHFTVTNLGADLAATYGTNWNQSTTLFWSAVRSGGSAVSSQPDAVIGKGNGNPAAGASAPYAVGYTTSYVNSAARGINNKSGLLTDHSNSGLLGYQGLVDPQYTSTHNSSVAIVPTANTTSWSTIAVPNTSSLATVFGLGSSQNPDYTVGKFEQGTDFDLVNAATVGGYYVTDLYYIKFNGAGNVSESYVGSLGLSADGTITYANQASYFATAVPEPATYAAIAGALMLGLALYRRRRASLGEGAR